MTVEFLPSLKILGISLHFLKSGTAQLSVLVIGIVVAYFLNGVIVEHITRTLGFKHIPWTNAFFEMFFFTVFAFLEVRFSSHSHTWVWRRGVREYVPWKGYMMIAGAVTMGRGLSWMALSSVSFPTTTVIKSSKLVVVMIGSTLLLRKRFHFSDYIVALGIVLGMVLFTLADSKTSKSSDTVHGLVAGLGSVVCDAVVSTLQEKNLRQHKRSVGEMLLVTNVVSCVILGIIMVAMKEVPIAADRLMTTPNLGSYLTLAATFGYLGLNLWTTCIGAFGAVITTAAGILRKFLNVVMSFVIFPKPFFLQHGLGCFVFFAALALSWVQQREREKGNVHHFVPEYSDNNHQNDNMDSKV